MAIRSVGDSTNKWVCGRCGQIYQAPLRRIHFGRPDLCECEEVGPFTYGFKDLKESSDARRIFERLGVLGLLEDSETWTDLRERIARHNDVATDYAFGRNACKLNAEIGSGDRLLLNSILFATGFDHLADKFDQGPTGELWTRLHALGPARLHALVCCIARQD